MLELAELGVGGVFTDFPASCAENVTPSSGRLISARLVARHARGDAAHRPGSASARAADMSAISVAAGVVTFTRVTGAEERLR